MKKGIGIAIVIACLFFTGCEEEHKTLYIHSHNKHGGVDLDMRVYGADTYNGCDTVETDTGIDVILHYKK